MKPFEYRVQHLPFLPTNQIWRIRKSKKEIVKIISDAPELYSTIKDDFRQENFVTAISVMYFLHIRENEPDFLFPWLFQLLQNNNGNIRHAAVRMINHELGPLTVHIRCPEIIKSGDKLSPQKAEQILLGLRTNLNSLLDISWKPAYKKYKYVNDLPSGIYKSAQLLLSYIDDCCMEVSYHLKNDDVY